MNAAITATMPQSKTVTDDPHKRADRLVVWTIVALNVLVIAVLAFCGGKL